MRLNKKSLKRVAKFVDRTPGVRAGVRKLTQTGMVPDGIWKRLPVERPFKVELVSGGTFMYAPTAMDGIGRSLYWRGINQNWEVETLRVFESLIKDSNAFLDIGANTGVYSLVACAANHQCRVMAFEPVPRIYSLLDRNIRLNAFEERCQPERQAVSSFVGTTEFHVPSIEVPTSGSMHPQGFRGYPGELISVQVTTVDKVRESFGDFDVCKIDVEGFEDKVLQGMESTLNETSPTIIFECNADGPNDVIERILIDHGYNIFHLSPDGVVRVNKISPTEKDEFRNYLAVKRETVMSQLGVS